MKQDKKWVSDFLL